MNPYRQISFQEKQEELPCLCCGKDGHQVVKVFVEHDYLTEHFYFYCETYPETKFWRDYDKKNTR